MYHNYACLRHHGVTGFLLVAQIADPQTDHDWGVDNARWICPGTARTMRLARLDVHVSLPPTLLSLPVTTLPGKPCPTNRPLLLPAAVLPQAQPLLPTPPPSSSSHPPGMLGHGRHCSYENAFIKEEEEKSDADDLFAFLPVDR